MGGTSSRVSAKSFIRPLSSFSVLSLLLVAKSVTLLLGPFCKVTGYAIPLLVPACAVQPRTNVCRTRYVQPIVRPFIVVAVLASLISQKIVRLSVEQVCQ